MSNSAQKLNKHIMKTLKKLAEFLDNNDEEILLVTVGLGGLIMVARFIIGIY